VLGAVGAPLLSTVVGKFGEWIWSAFLEQAPK
jgi:hypothetical protein